MKDDSKFNVQVDISRGYRDIEDLNIFDDENIMKKKNKKNQEEGDVEKIKGTLPQVGKVVYKKVYGFVASSFERLIAYIKNYEREKLDIPQKHFFIGHHEYDCLTSRVDKLTT